MGEIENGILISVISSFCLGKWKWVMVYVVVMLKVMLIGMMMIVISVVSSVV